MNKAELKELEQRVSEMSESEREAERDRLDHFIRVKSKELEVIKDLSRRMKLLDQDLGYHETQVKLLRKKRKLINKEANYLGLPSI